MLSLANIHSSYNSVADKFKNVANWDEARVPLKQISEEINTLHQELTQHLGDLIQGFSQSRFDHHTNSPERGYKSRTLTIGGDEPTKLPIGYDFSSKLPKALSEKDIPGIQIMETKTRDAEQPEITEFMVKIFGGKQSYGVAPLQYTFKATEFGAKIDENNLRILNVEDSKYNHIHYSSKGITQDANDPNLATSNETRYQGPCFTFKLNDPNEIPTNALDAETQKPRNESQPYWRYLSEAHGWNKAFVTAT